MYTWFYSSLVFPLPFNLVHKLYFFSFFSLGFQIGLYFPSAWTWISFPVVFCLFPEKLAYNIIELCGRNWRAWYPSFLILHGTFYYFLQCPHPPHFFLYFWYLSLWPFSWLKASDYSTLCNHIIPYYWIVNLSISGTLQIKATFLAYFFWSDEWCFPPGRAAVSTWSNDFVIFST